MTKINIGVKTVRILRVTHPELIAEIEASLHPKLEDPRLIQEIYRYVFYSDLCLNVNYQEIMFVAVVLKLYSPEAIIIKCKTKSGLREAIGTSLSKSGPHVSYLIDQARAYMKIKAFKENVATMVDEYFNQEGFTGSQCNKMQHTKRDNTYADQAQGSLLPIFKDNK